MAKKYNNPFSMGEGYPVSSNRDGINTANHPEGSKDNMFQIRPDRREYVNSETGERCAPPEYVINSRRSMGE